MAKFTRCSTFLASLGILAAGSASAAIIPGGDFTGPDAPFPQSTTIDTGGELDAGWFTGFNNRWGITGNVAQGPPGAFGAYNVFGQLFTDTLDRVGTQTLSFDLDADLTGSGTFQFLVVGTNTLGTSGDDQFDLRPEEANGTSPEDPTADINGANFTVLGSGTVDLGALVGPDTITATLDFGAGFDYIGIRLGTEDLVGGERVAFVDNIAITVPEPASMALIAAGGLIALPRRRRG